jgi:hypothetical protein
MFIAFEGPDNTGKSTAAKDLDCAGKPEYNVTKAMHAHNVETMWEATEGVSMPHCYDRIDWFSHMVYRLALPDRDWNDDRPRTVFAMPDTHLVVRLHHPSFADFTADEIVDTPIKPVNEMYYHQTEFYTNLNRHLGYTLFKSVTIVEVENPKQGQYLQRIVDHDSAPFDFGTVAPSLVKDSVSLLEFLHYVDQHIG